MKTTHKPPQIPPPLRSFIGTLILTMVSFLVSRSAVAQCPPTPTTYTNGAIEGLVAEDLAAEAAVAAQGEGKFIVIYAKPVGAPGVNAIYVHRFEANGDCICELRDPGDPLDDDFCPAFLTVIEGQGRGIHQRPSIAMNRGADGRAEWFAVWSGGLSFILASFRT